MNYRKIYALILAMLILAVGIVRAGDEKGEPEGAKPEKKSEIVWHKYDEGVKLAKEQNKKVFIEFTATWCGWCKKMQATTFKDADIINLIDEYFVAVSVDGDSKDSLNIDGWITTEKKLAREEFGVSSYPTFWFLSPENEKIAPMKGYRDAKSLGMVLNYLKDDKYKTVTFQDFVESQKETSKN